MLADFAARRLMIIYAAERRGWRATKNRARIDNFKDLAVEDTLSYKKKNDK